LPVGAKIRDVSGSVAPVALAPATTNDPMTARAATRPEILAIMLRIPPIGSINIRPSANRNFIQADVVQGIFPFCYHP
jgi:hypothetical protein